MTIDASIVGKVAAIIPRLASNHDGEIVASVKAIERIIKGTGGDWHDLAATFTRGAAVVVVGANKPPAEPKPSSCKKPPKWRDLSHDKRVAWMTLCAEKAHLSAWEQSFAESILAALRDDPYRPVSPKQEAVINRLLAAAFSWGYRP